MFKTDRRMWNLSRDLWKEVSVCITSLNVGNGTHAWLQVLKRRSCEDGVHGRWGKVVMVRTRGTP